ncbi:PREDICTED: LOW QUALITY PROTEIN: melanoma-associated antigen B10-like [Hipposideros armiger]|uniref:LOW QUALITY PROTEIN: melanoma-associated antigen B10-like n=1 Tax=Hipposideros armiger TaxID=186990 RepID=A0A8B7SFQ2_HIPAR|nr:PREDICTED: LOW QUALITY PROTEIN: melanoma-associated antigen B10-like [Hipposideros armiger]
MKGPEACPITLPTLESPLPNIRQRTTGSPVSHTNVLVLFGGNSQNSPAVGSVRKSQRSWRAPSATTASAGVSCTRSDEGAKSKDKKRPSTSQARPGTDSSCRIPLDQKAIQLVQFMLCKHNMREPITKEDMMSHVIQRSKKHFHEILRRVSELMVLAFGIDGKEVDPTRHGYTLVSKLEHMGDGRLSGEETMPRAGLLVTILCVAFMKGNCATEEDIWKVFNMMCIYAVKKHFIHGEPKKLITQAFVQERYLESRQVPNSDPPCYEFLWGPKAHTETTKMTVLEFLAKIHDIVPSAFPSWYEEALRDEEERAQARVAAMLHTDAMASVLPRVSLSSLSHQ